MLAECLRKGAAEFLVYSPSLRVAAV